MSETNRESMQYDIIIVGGGPAGLSCAIKLKQLAKEQKKDISVCLIEKGSEIGAHILSGAVFETKALDELIPDWKDKNAPITTKAGNDEFLLLTKEKSYKLPTPPQMKNHGNYIISLGNLCKWLAEQAEELEVEIYPGFAAAEILYNDDESVKGVATGDMGIDKDGNKTSQFESGVELHATQTIFAEGCHGSLTKELISKFNLRKGKSPQTYGLGIKEVWEIDPKNHNTGSITHTIGWPMDQDTYGGSWLYHMEDNKISIGFVIGLDYKNPYLSPFEEMQRFKTHPKISKILENGKRLSFGAKTLVEGGIASLPKLSFAGGILIGDCAGFMNVPKIKGNHNAMKSGMLAAEAILETISNENNNNECYKYEKLLKNSWVWKELYKSRNIRAGFNKGLYIGLINALFQTMGGWLLPFTFKNHADHEQIQNISQHKPIDYPKPDGKLTFDRLSSVFLTGTNHGENQQSHLKLKNTEIPLEKNLVDFDEPSQRYCPASVYEIVEENGQKSFKINAQNCIHCKTCDIKDPSQNIEWTVPQGGEGPNYSNM